MEILRTIKKATSGLAKRIGQSVESVPEVSGSQTQQDRLDEFKFRYRSFLETVNILGSQKLDAETGAALLAESRVKEHVKGMLRVLLEEDRANTAVDSSLADTLGLQPSYPVMEYFFEERVMRSLCELGIADQPIGTMSLVLGTAAALLLRIEYPLLPSQHVHYPISELITAAMYYHQVGVRRRHGHSCPNADLARAMVQKNLVSLVATIWRRLREDPAQLDFFLDVDPQGGRPPRLDIFDAVLPYVTSPGDVGLLAREAVLMALSLGSSRVELYAVYHTDLCLQLAMHLAGSYSLLPRSVEDHHPSKSPSHSISSPQTQSLSPTAKEAKQMEERERDQEIISEFFRHLKFCNAVSIAAMRDKVLPHHQLGRLERVQKQPPNTSKDCMLGKGHDQASIVDSVWNEIFRNFLEKSLKDDLLKPFGMTFQAALGYTVQIINQMSKGSGEQTPLLQRFLDYLFVGKDNHIRTQLVRCLEFLADPSMRLSALSLLAAVLRFQDDRTLVSLLVYDCEDGEETKRTSSSQLALNSDLLLNFCLKFPNSPLDCQVGDSQSKIEGDQLFQDYLEESRRQVILSTVSRTLKKNSTESLLASTPTGSRQNSPAKPKQMEADQSEVLTLDTMKVIVQQLDRSGGLVHSLFNRLERFFEATLDENILLTEIVSKLVRESAATDGSIYLQGLFYALFSTELSENEGKGCRTMASILHKLWTEARRKYETTPQASSRAQLIRYTLGLDSWGSSKNLKVTPIKKPNASETPSPFLENYVLLEEFLKEILSILQAKVEFPLSVVDLNIQIAEDETPNPEECVDWEEEESTHSEPDFDIEVIEKDLEEEIKKLEMEFI